MPSSPNSSNSRARRRGADPLANLLEYLDDIDRAVVQRDGMAVTALLRKRVATHLPRDVRDELLALAHAPRASLRAPIQFLRFQHRMIELSRGGERLLTAQTELRLDTRPTEGSARRNDGERRTAAYGSVDRNGKALGKASDNAEDDADDGFRP